MQEGVSKAGNAWKKREWVMETFGQYPRKVKFHVFGDKCMNMGIEVGQSYRLSFDLESREFNGRWYTDVSVFACSPLEAQAGGYAPQGAYPQAQPAPQYAAPQAVAPAAPVPPADASDDLPF